MRYILKINEFAEKKNKTKLSFIIRRGLVYYKKDEIGKLKFYISKNIVKRIFTITYDELGYRDYVKIYERLADNLYIFYIKKKLHEYIRYYLRY